MATQLTQHVFGALGIEDNDEILINQYGQDVIFEATTDIVNRHNADIAQYERMFVEGDIVKPKTLYMLATGGELEKITNLTQPKALKTGFHLDVAFPLEEWGAKLGGDRVALAYMSARQYGRNLMAILLADAKLRRREILRALFHNAPPAFNDERFGALNVKPLANGDAQLYPPTVEADDPAVENNYLVTGFAPATISTTNDPITPAVNKLESHFGLTATGSPIAAFMNVAQVPQIKLMGQFVPLENIYEQLAITVTRSDMASFPTAGMPGTLFGTFDGRVGLFRWDRIPANYIMSVHLQAPPPLMRRIDDPRTPFAPGLRLVQERVDEPLRDAWWSNRFGYGVGNRLSCVVTYIATGATYVVPPRYLLA
jgi:hypothetical protein